MGAQPRLHAYIRSLVYNPSDVDDILQEIAAIGWQKYASYDSSRPFDAWIFGIAKMQVRSYLTYRRRDKHIFGDEALNLLEQVASKMSEHTDAYKDALQECLAHISHGDQQLLQHRFERCSSNREVSIAAGLSESKVSRSLNRIYAALMLCVKRRMRSEHRVRGGLA